MKFQMGVAAIIGIISICIVGYYSNWKVALGIWVCLYANNFLIEGSRILRCENENTNL